MFRSFVSYSALLILSMIGFGTPLYGQNADVVIKINEDPIKRDYKILYSNSTEDEVIITLLGPQGGTILSDKMGVAKGFMKKYSLVDAPLGSYTWEVQYGNKTYSEEFEIKSEKKLIKESIKASLDDLLNLNIEVAKYNSLPVTIFIYNGFKEQLEFIFWEPTLDERVKAINLSKYDAYDFKLEVMQQGEVVLEQEFQSY